jgi:hypothetical protein
VSATYRGCAQGIAYPWPGEVTVTRDGDTRPLIHHIRHSPTGFAWGYAGSGPADLARSILWDHLGGEPHPACYQGLKFAFVATWSQSAPWELRSEEIDEWLSGYDGQRTLTAGLEQDAVEDLVDRMARLESEVGFDQAADDPESM